MSTTTKSTTTPLVWFITGTSSGFGFELTKAALARGDKVIATARSVSKITGLKELGASTLSLDITASDAEVQEVVSKAVEIYGRIDVLVNNAGYILEGFVEEVSALECQNQFTTNVFGHLTVTRAVLPYMRSQRSGVIANMGSIAGWSSAASLGFYCATKMALVALTQALKQEVAPLGIDVTIIEPGYFRTNFLDQNARVHAKSQIADYEEARKQVQAGLGQYDNNQPGDPVKGASVIVELLRKEGRAEGKELPARFALGPDAQGGVEGVLERSRKELDELRSMGAGTNFEG